MPKEIINWPLPTAIVQVVGEDAPEPDPLPAGPQVALHWDGNSGNVQLSLDIDLDVLSRIIEVKRENPNAWDGSEAGRQVFYTETLSRADLQRLIKASRRARDSVFGADA